MTEIYTLQGVRVIYKNFSGKETDYNQEGTRVFSIVLDDATAEELAKIGFNVKVRPPNERYDSELKYLTIEAKYTHFPPRAFKCLPNGRLIALQESNIGELDWENIPTVDVVFTPYYWKYRGRTGIKAYLKTLVAKIQEDPLDVLYKNFGEAAEVEPTEKGG